MADISFDCPACGASMEADESFRGSQIDCPACGTKFIVPSLTLEPGVDIDGFRLVRRLGAGGMGEVWLAKQESLNRHIAIKILSSKVAGDQEFVSRFEQEVKMVGKLNHPNIITAYQAGFCKGVHYLAMEYVDGAELSSRMKVDRVIQEHDALRLVKKVAEALDHAWTRHKVLHRDIKPENIMITSEGEPEIMDLGISKSLTEDSSLTMTGVVMGTPYYMSPEQARAEKDIDCRSDIYSLGATLFHMVTGSVPYEGTTAFSIIAKHLSTDPSPSPRAINKNISPQCAALIKMMMSKERERRQDSWKAVIHDIDRVMAGKFPEGGDSKTASIRRPGAAGGEGDGAKTPPRWFMPAASWAMRIALYAAVAVLAYGLWNASGFKSQDVKDTPSKEEEADKAKSPKATVENSLKAKGHQDPPPLRPPEERPEIESQKQEQPEPGPEPKPKDATPETPKPEPAPAPAPVPTPTLERHESPLEAALNITAKQPEPAQQTRQEPEKGQTEFDRIAVEVAKAIFRGRTPLALKTLRDCDDNPELRPFSKQIRDTKDICHAVMNAEMKFLIDLQRNIGETRSLKFRGQDVKCRILEVEMGDPKRRRPSVITLLDTDTGRSYSVGLPDFALSERIRFVENESAAAALRGIDMARHGDAEEASKQFASAGALSGALSMILEDKDFMEKAAQTGDIEPRPQKPKDSVQTQAQKPKDVKSLFKGEVKSFVAATLDITVIYDFSNPAQLEDWEKLSEIGEGNSLSVERSKLIIIAEGSLFIASKARFDSMTVTSKCQFKTDGIYQGLSGGGKDNTTFFLAGVGGDRQRIDIAFKGFPDFSRLALGRLGKPSKLRPDAKISALLSLKNGKASFKANDANNWQDQTLNLPPDGVAILIGTTRSRNEYDEIVIKGRLNRTWYESVFGGKSQ